MSFSECQAPLPKVKPSLLKTFWRRFCIMGVGRIFSEVSSSAFLQGGNHDEI